MSTRVTSADIQHRKLGQVVLAPRADPINQALAAEGIPALNAGLPLITDHPDNRVGRQQAHAQPQATVLPYVLAFNAPVAPEAAQRIAAAFGGDDGSVGVNLLRKTLNAPDSTQELRSS